MRVTRVGRWLRLGALLLATGACGAEFRVVRKGDTAAMRQFTAVALVPIDKPKPPTVVTMEGKAYGGFFAVQEAQLARPVIFGQLLARLARVRGLTVITDAAAAPPDVPRLYLSLSHLEVGKAGDFVSPSATADLLVDVLDGKAHRIETVRLTASGASQAVHYKGPGIAVPRTNGPGWNFYSPDKTYTERPPDERYVDIGNGLADRLVEYLSQRTGIVAELE